MDPRGAGGDTAQRPSWRTLGHRGQGGRVTGRRRGETMGRKVGIRLAGRGLQASPAARCGGGFDKVAVPGLV